MYDNMVYDEKFWSDRYTNNQIGWDIGSISTPIKEYIDQLSSTDLTILIPGCGNAHEAEYLWNKGFKNTYLCDISASPLEAFKERNPSFPSKQLIQGDFFDLKGEFDLILEQTFFCALDPSLRKKYIEKTYLLLKPRGKLVGVLFGIEFTKPGPPFGGNIDTYKKQFSTTYSLQEMALCYNSIPPRKGAEIFIILQKQESGVENEIS